MITPIIVKTWMGFILKEQLIVEKKLGRWENINPGINPHSSQFSKSIYSGSFHGLLVLVVVARVKCRFFHVAQNTLCSVPKLWD